MFEYKKKVQIMWRASSDYFELANKGVIDQTLRNRPLGINRNGITNMLRNTEELKALMPIILGTTASLGHDPNWNASVSNYWNSLSHRIPFPSETWEVGMYFDIDDNDPIRKEFISKLPENVRKTDEALADWVMGVNNNGVLNVPVEYRYRYGTPIEVAQFLLWQYSLNYSAVANDKSLVEKSTNIQFYLIDELELKKEKESLHRIKTEATKLYLETISNPTTVVDILFVLKRDIPFDTPEDEVKMVREQLLEKISLDNPTEFIATAKSTNLKTLAKIERYIKEGILRRLDNTPIVVDGSNPEIVIGNSVEEQLAYFSSAINKDVVSEYAAKYKSYKLKT